jgi:hypothetical protein
MQSEFRENTVTAKLQSTMSTCEWWITVVFGPQEDGNKLLFMNELRQISTLTFDRWLVIGDFNMITRPQDKSSGNINLRLMGTFRKLLDDLELKELGLKGRMFTWSNSRTHTRIDRAFCSSEWDTIFPNSTLQAGSQTTARYCWLETQIVENIEVSGSKRFGQDYLGT